MNILYIVIILRYVEFVLFQLEDKRSFSLHTQFNVIFFILFMIFLILMQLDYKSGKYSIKIIWKIVSFSLRIVILTLVRTSMYTVTVDEWRRMLENV